MADGYTWNDSTPISSPAKTSGWNSKIEDNVTEKTMSIEAIVSGVAGDVVDSLEQKLTRTTPVYLAPLKELNATTSIFDHSLRSKLISQGYTLSNTPTESYALAYDIQKSNKKDAPELAHDFIIFDMTGEKATIIETRTQELPEPRN